MTSEEKFAFVDEQMQEMWATGKETVIACPYCTSFVAPGGPPCCGTLFRAVSALIDARVQVDRLNFARQIQENAHSN